MNKTFDRYASIVFLLIGLAFMIGSFGISTTAYGSAVGPNIFPLGLGAVMVILSIRLFYETLRYKDEDKEKEKLDFKRFFIILGTALLYALTLETLGYVITTFVFLLVGFQVMEKGKWIKSIIIAGLFSFGIYYVFVEILEGTLPGWPVWFR